MLLGLASPDKSAAVPLRAILVFWPVRERQGSPGDSLIRKQYFATRRWGGRPGDCRLYALGRPYVVLMRGVKGLSEPHLTIGRGDSIGLQLDLCRDNEHRITVIQRQPCHVRQTAFIAYLSHFFS